MSKATKLFIYLALLFMFFLLACAPLPAPVMPSPVSVAEKQSWQITWEHTLQEAIKEKKVVIYGSHGPDLRDSLTEAFRKKHGLNIEWIPGRSSELVSRIKAERRVGLFLGDIFITSSDSLLSIKEKVLLAALETELALPEVKEPSFWMEGRLPWVDREHFIISPSQALSYGIVINRDRVKASEISSYQDLLQPRWKDKIASVDPRVSSSRSWVYLAQRLGWDYVEKLADQVKLAASQRLAVEWTVQGKTLITLNAGESFLEFLLAGSLLESVRPIEGVYLSGGGSSLAVMRRRPHLNTTRVFVNWYLSKEGQQIVAPSHGYTRADINTSLLHPTRIRTEGAKYFSVEEEDWIKGSLETEIKIKELFRDR